MTTGQDIVDYARTWIGAKWRHQARGVDLQNPAIDCVGLLIVTAKHFELPHEDLFGYGRNPERQFVKQIKDHTVISPENKIVNGAIGIFTDTTMPCHTGIFSVSDSGLVTLIHSEYRPKGRCHEENIDNTTPSIRSRLIGVRLFKDVDYG